MLITSNDNKRLKELKKLASSKAARKREGVLFCEGDTLLKDALTYHAPIKEVWFRAGHECPLPEGTIFNSLPDKLFDALSEVETPQNAVFLTAIREKEAPDAPPLILDGVADPGNLGTIIRTAVAFDIPLFIGEGSADFTSPKVVRSAMGALFRASIRTGDVSEEVERLKAKGIAVLSATLGERSRLLGEADIGNTAFVVGNEANGVSEKVKALSSGEIIIPMKGECESLNAAVAAAILMWEMAK